MSEPTGHVFRVERARGPQWYAKYGLPDGRQVQKRIGPAWADRRRPPSGYFTKRQAEAWLRRVLDEARRGSLPGMVCTGATFADVAAEWLPYVERDLGGSRRPWRATGPLCGAQLLPEDVIDSGIPIVLTNVANAWGALNIQGRARPCPGENDARAVSGSYVSRARLGACEALRKPRQPQRP